MRRHLGWLAAIALASCSPDPQTMSENEQLSLGELPEIKADGQWGDATKCKAIPALQPLVDPAITLSTNGLTLRLEDRATGFERVYPVGVGAINHEAGQTAEGLSRTLYPVLATGGHSFSIKTTDVEPCTIWWKEPETGDLLPVFAGLPFMSFYGPYGIHGPVSAYWLPSGGKLKRGFVSHGCVRMEGADVAELWAYIRGVAEVPVRVQQATERRPDGTAVDISQRWILSECQDHADCNFAGGYCRENSHSGRGICTAACDRLCHYDRYGYPVTFCVADDAQAAEGFCTYKASDLNDDCRRHTGFVGVQGVPRFSQPQVTADACMPGSQGWIGDRCLDSGDCGDGRTCELVGDGSFGFCTEPCALYCPDQTARAGTFCVEGLCRARCELDDNSATCPAGFQCLERPRHNQPTTEAPACMPAGAQ